MNSLTRIVLESTVAATLAGCSSGNTPTQAPRQPNSVQQNDATSQITNTGFGNQNQGFQTTNNPPIIDTIQPQTVQAGGSLALTVSARDPENGALNYRFSTVGDVFPKQTSASGLFQISFPATMGAGIITAIVQVTDSGGASANVNFPITVQVQPGPSVMNQVVNKTCDSITDPLQNAACKAVGIIVK